MPDVTNAAQFSRADRQPSGGKDDAIGQDVLATPHLAILRDDHCSKGACANHPNGLQERVNEVD